MRATEKENVIVISSVVFITRHHLDLYPKRMEYTKRIEYILEWNLQFTRKKCKTTILLYCFHTTGVLHICVLNNLLGPGKSKIDIKRKPNYEIGWFHN